MRACWQPAAVAERYRLFPASADGIGKRYMGREISAVMGWQGAAWLEREERDREERTDLLLAALALKPGMVVADIGAGTGYLSRRMAPAVMPGGKVWAVDVQPEMISLLQANLNRRGQKWLRLFEQLSPIYRWSPGELRKVQSCPRRRASLATNAKPRWATRGAPGSSSYAADFNCGNAARYFSCGVSRSMLECGRSVLYQFR